jgi:hypothetical protein
LGYLLGHILGDCFKNSSGHPVDNGEEAEKKYCSKKSNFVTLFGSLLIFEPKKILRQRPGLPDS